jgi:hypothetical protein
MQKEQLLELRRKIVQSTQEIALRGEGSPAERLQVLLSIVRNGDASIEVLSKAYELAQASDSDDDKLAALLDVLYEVDAKLSAEPAESGTVDTQVSEQPQPDQQNQQ